MGWKNDAGSLHEEEQEFEGHPARLVLELRSFVAAGGVLGTAPALAAS